MNENKASKSHRIIQWERVHSMALLYLTFFIDFQTKIHEDQNHRQKRNKKMNRD